ncbi:hypothetical protein Dfri01_13440 [Dyadobacter frigoris]|uniref:hypothetical protein n=1 Tax=Dyadobacter frigoris TaxID=2576211 RepID=UPI0024A442EC|nr:hypothetical protein [Dyadobacter frigoris]GLU51883.1 hypothetical protein Dfri01_13440 [Dyadobacter frigoris]
MKNVFVVILLFIAVKSQGQIYKPENFRPEIYLDSVKYGSFPNFDIHQIDSISISKENKKVPEGQIFIKSKNPKNLYLLSILDITARYKKNALTPTIYMLDNEILKEVSTFRIDSSYILKVEVLKGSETDYLNTQFPDLTILNIVTRTEKNIAKENEIRIRGIEKRSVPQPNTDAQGNTIFRIRGVSTASM